MKNMLRPRMALAFMMALATTSLADEPATRPSTTDAMTFASRYVDDQTLAVGHLDIEHIDLVALEKFLNQQLDALGVKPEDPMRKPLPLGMMMLAGYKARLSKLGARHVYLLISHPDAWPAMEPVALLLPLEKGGDAKAMVEFFQAIAKDSLTVSKLADDVVYVGQAAPLKRLLTIKPVRRPDFEAGFTATKGAALELVLAPTNDVRRALSELLPRLPVELAADQTEASTEFLTRGVQALAVSVELPPKFAGRAGLVTIRPAPDVALEEEKLRKFLARLIELLVESEPFKKDAPPPVREFLKGLKYDTIVQNGVAVTGISLDEKTIQDAVKALTPAVEQARMQAKRAASTAQLRQVTVAIYCYAENHDNQWPQNMDALVEAKLIPANLLLNPTDPKQRRYEYHPWTRDQLKKAGSGAWPAAWESVDDENSSRNVAFVDGHVEFMDAKAFAEALKKAREQAAR